jgi:hypothetical protein
MVRIGIVGSLVVLASCSALGEPLRAISGRPLLLPYGIEGGAMSPDGRWFAAQGSYGEGLVVVHVASDTTVRRFRTASSAIRHFGLGYPYAAAAPVWDPQSKFVWVTDVDNRGGGFPVGPMQPAKAVVGDAITPWGPRSRSEAPTDPVDRLGAPEHPAGLLDTLLYANDRGRAIAQFGSKASMRSLDETTEQPAFAMIDVESKRIIASLPFADAMAPLVAAAGERLDRLKVFAGAATTMPDGRMRLFAVMSARKSRDPDQWVQTWLVWTEGESPRLLPQPYAQLHHARYGLSPDGATLLAVLPLGPGMMCSRIGGCQVTGPPVEGPLVVAHDLATGAVLWTLRATAAEPGNRRVPVVSPNGRLALVELPGPALGVLDMTDGRLLQTTATRHYASFGFFQQGRCAFIQQPDQLLVFEVGAATSTQPSQPMIDVTASRCRSPIN